MAKITEEISWQAHPNVFEIVHNFKAEQAAVEVSIAQLQAGAHPPPPPPRSYSAIEKMKKIEEMKRKFVSDEIRLYDYLKGLAGHTVQKH